MLSIEPGHEVCKKEFHLQVKRPSAIAADCPKQFGLRMIIPNVVFIGT